MKIGFGRQDITPRVGVELCGFGPYLHRYSIGVRDRLWARAMAVEAGGQRVVLVSCDLPATSASLTARIRDIVSRGAGLLGSALMVHSTHTHSGPNTMDLIGWGEPDEPYLELLPGRIAAACIAALKALQPATLSHAEVPCEGIGQNREFDRDGLPIEEVMRPGWRPNKPELTDTTCHVLKAEANGRVIGFVSYFGCHPVVCCQQTRYIHGDFCGVATNLVEQEYPGATGLFLQGAQGDVNPRFVHKPEAESLKALDTIAGEYAECVRNGLRRARPIDVDGVASAQHLPRFKRKPWDLAKLRELLAKSESVLASTTDDNNHEYRMNTVFAVSLRRMIAKMQSGGDMSEPLELQGFRIGPLALLGTPFEVFQSIKNEAVAASRAEIPLVMGFCNAAAGYATDRTAAARGGYAQDTCPLMLSQIPYADAHGDLVEGLTKLDQTLVVAAEHAGARR
ncbi:MAG TPA: neutral/alkaline non-lysosomal ceramidase N-terminal domain-containing protein [Planctomycetota bacterium]|nr:neutral/alkaline non-lysosomal ceramidase N-terminal domain-containing protein [Planctomycetota bacterium]